MTIGITGSTGFFGKHLVTLLHKKYLTVKEFDRTRYSLFEKESLKDFVQGTDIIVHLAGVSKNYPDDVIKKINIEGTVNLLESISTWSPQTRLIFISSFQVYSPYDSFGQSKKKAEEEIEWYKKHKKLRASILRFSNLYGIACPPFAHSVISTFIELVKTNKPITVYNGGKQKRDFLYVTEACDAILKVIQKGDDFAKPLTICTGRMVTLQFVIDLLGDFTGREIEVYNKPSNEKSNYTVYKNYEVAQKLLGWTPTITLEEGLRKVLTYEKII